MKKKGTEKGKKEEKEEWTGNSIRAEGAKAISETLKINTTLTSMNLGCDDTIW